jgi:hypothetical protein
VVLRQVNDLWFAIPFDPVTEREYAEQRRFPVLMVTAGDLCGSLQLPHFT